MSKPKIALRLRASNYSGLAALGNHCIGALTGNGNFTTPLPTLISVGAAVTDVEAAIALWGEPGSRGSHSDLQDLRTKSKVLYQLLQSLARYVETTAATAAGLDYDTMASIIATSGFAFRNAANPQGVLQKVENFRRLVSPQLNVNQVKLKWAKPLNTTSSGNVKNYKVYRATTNSFAAAQFIGNTTDTVFIDTNDTALQATWTYFIIAVNSAGNGVTSDALTVTVAGLV